MTQLKKSLQTLSICKESVLYKLHTSFLSQCLLIGHILTWFYLKHVSWRISEKRNRPQLD